MWRFFSFPPHRGMVFSLCLLMGLGLSKSDLSLTPLLLSQSNNTQGREEKGEKQLGQTTQHNVETLASCKPSLGCI